MAAIKFDYAKAFADKTSLQMAEIIVGNLVGYRASRDRRIDDIRGVADAVEALRAMPPKTVILNPALHAKLTALGFVHTHHEADYEDIGDAENGPELSGGPAYDEYESDTERVIVDATGELHREQRDKALEAWIAEQQDCA